ncbi:er lumen protein retaining receptor 2, related [Neospora caninum Liverpool]|uniref:ER lumen protein Retaining receptor 2, related n=1 Tax=Neospora caninum (strain Liverpool) TaxID=572307 RepID=F0V7A4_NEOCL|nr:er lumen protein retaining receptor 2, related [Neospora caninum Liverpool]CBZ49595.1 er lumen protein retaining receptor 2, related [Neospora caninum Liverpool]CEL64175.1 TPA: ER lumen protein retaining receptor 2, related [Neospora caninum Liverpool]|eukprot:XP_003879630.1 er lumen protein retaining receptor 2, related [Neospora caninum Liverpool]
MLQMWIRLLTLMAVAALFIVQQVAYPLVTVWVALGEYLHCASYVLLLDLVITNRGLKGLSVKTQICFLFVHWFRYCDSFFTAHSNHWIFALKLFYMVVSVLLVASLICLRNTWERRKDTCSLLVLFFISLILGVVNFFVDDMRPASSSDRILHFFWIVSHYLQGFAMLPQFVFCYRDPDNKDSLLTAYVLVLGSYRLAYAVNWIERAYKENFFYISGPLGLSILILFLGDFVVFKLKNKSFISSFVLRIDDTIDASQQPLLQAVYGSNYERLSLAEAAQQLGSARIPPIEIDLQHVHVVGRPTADISSVSTSTNSPATGAANPAKSAASQSAGDTLRGAEAVAAREATGGAISPTALYKLDDESDLEEDEKIMFGIERWPEREGDRTSRRGEGDGGQEARVESVMT